MTLVEEDPSPETLKFSELVTNALGLKPVLVHVIGVKEEKADGQRLLDDAHAMRKEQKAELKVLAGDVEHQILAELGERPYKLIILGTALARVELSPTQLSRRLADKADISVLIIRRPPKTIRNLLVCTGGRPQSIPAIEWGIQIAKASGAKATFLHVVSSPPAMYTGLDALDEGIQDVLERDSPLGKHLRATATMAEEAGIEADMELRHGVVTEEILRACDLKPYDLVIIGAPAPGALLDRLMLGRVGPQLLASNPHSTLIARGDFVSEQD
jgi:nucleotide-binding universal stress UspA family protein